MEWNARPKPPPLPREELSTSARAPDAMIRLWLPWTMSAVPLSMPPPPPPPRTPPPFACCLEEDPPFLDDPLPVAAPPPPLWTLEPRESLATLLSVPEEYMACNCDGGKDENEEEEEEEMPR